jgi:ParB/RepB/Spo0J family partition protein
MSTELITPETTNAVPETFAGRKGWREHMKIGQSTFKIDVAKIKVIEGFNPRKEFEEIEELAESIKVHGLQDPLRGDLSEDGQTFYVRDGERRFRAILYLIENGEMIRDEPIEFIEVLPYSPRLTEEEKLILNLSSNNKKKYKPMEMAEALLRLKYPMGKDDKDSARTHEQVAELIGKSRQYVDGMIHLAEAPEPLKEKVTSGEITQTDAIRHAREKTKPADEMAGILPKSKTQSGNTYIPGDSEGGKDASQSIDFDKEDTEQEKWINNLAKNVNKIEALGKGLNDQAQKDLDDLLRWIRTDIDSLKIFHGNKRKDVSQFVSLESVQQLIHVLKDDAKSKLRDGYHSFEELYEHRSALYISLCDQLKRSEDAPPVWRTKVHFDGTIMDGWFLLGIGETSGHQITYHLPEHLWDKCSFALDWERAPEFDGHTPAEVIERLYKLLEL